MPLAPRVTFPLATGAASMDVVTLLGSGNELLAADESALAYMPQPF